LAKYQGNNSYREQYQRPQQHRKQLQFRFGEPVFFHASLYPAKNKNATADLVGCQGVVVRVPRYNDPEVYKVLITSVTSRETVKLPTYRHLLGKKFLRKTDQLSKQEPIWWKDSGWLNLNKTKQFEVLNRYKSLYRYKNR